MKLILTSLVIFFSFLAQGQDLYSTPSGKKYHLSNCRMVNNVSTKITLASLKTTNLAACKICKPPNRESIESHTTSKNKAAGTKNTVQCKGKTKKGTRCKHKTSIANGYCFQHGDQAN